MNRNYTNLNKYTNQNVENAFHVNNNMARQNANRAFNLEKQKMRVQNTRRQKRANRSKTLRRFPGSRALVNNRSSNNKRL